MIAPIQAKNWTLSDYALQAVETADTTAGRGAGAANN
jgi:hypothetical protein